MLWLRQYLNVRKSCNLRDGLLRPPIVFDDMLNRSSYQKIFEIVAGKMDNAQIFSLGQIIIFHTIKSYEVTEQKAAKEQPKKN